MGSPLPPHQSISVKRMGRLEKPLDPAAGPVQQFAYELRKLRREAGTPTYRRMAADARYSAPTLSAAASGERLPSLPVTLAYVAACGGEPYSGSGAGARPPRRRSPHRTIRTRPPRTPDSGASSRVTRSSGGPIWSPSWWSW